MVNAKKSVIKVLIFVNLQNLIFYIKLNTYTNVTIYLIVAASITYY